MATEFLKFISVPEELDLHFLNFKLISVISANSYHEESGKLGYGYPESETQNTSGVHEPHPSIPCVTSGGE